MKAHLRTPLTRLRSGPEDHPHRLPDDPLGDLRGAHADALEQAVAGRLGPHVQDLGGALQGRQPLAGQDHMEVDIAGGARAFEAQVAFIGQEPDRRGVDSVPPVPPLGLVRDEIGMAVELVDLDQARDGERPVEMRQDERRAAVEVVDVFRHRRHSIGTTCLPRLRNPAEAILKASALALFLLTAACTHEARTVTAPAQATGMVAKAAAALQGRKSRIDQALEDAGA